MKRFALLIALLAGGATAPMTSADAATVMFSGTQSNTNAPGVAGGRCAGFTVSIANAGPFFSTGASNFGSFTTSQSHCLDSPPPIAAGSDAVPYHDGLFTYAFADGDTLFGAYAGTLTNSGVTGLINNLQTFSITGGSGRFAGATGGFLGTGTITFGPGSPPLSRLAFSGEINAPAIPEPATWALLIVGFGFAGTALRSQARRRAVG
ncbi:MAG: hypothetical protein JWQ29_1902 [Phenylobacterium sp.]|nr:hypothetical protein [Phenylobacterium sp.]